MKRYLRLSLIRNIKRVKGTEVKVKDLDAKFDEPRLVTEMIALLLNKWSLDLARDKFVSPSPYAPYATRLCGSPSLLKSNRK
jgi:hypothetical protein